MSALTQPSSRLIVLIPLFNDWSVAEQLVPSLFEVLDGMPVQSEVWLIDDGSTEAFPNHFLADHAEWGMRIRILSLRRNLGHQRAIAIGLASVHAREPDAHVLIMDGDGEDAPRYIPDLWKAREAGGVVFAGREKRSEKLFFRAGYQTFRWLHLLLIGRDIKMGNFSLVTPGALRRLAVVGEIWNHYAAAVVKARIPFKTVPTIRDRRLGGESKMNVVSLVMHGLNAISVHGDVASVRLLCASLVLAVAVIGAVGFMLLRRSLLPEGGSPGWAIALGLAAAVLVIQTATFSMLFALITLQNRQNMYFIPSRDHGFFVDNCASLKERLSGL